MPSTLREHKWLWLMIVIYFVVFAILSSLRHYNFQTQTWDMGAFVQTFWNTTQDRIMFNNLEEAKNHLGVHMSPFLFLLVPGYALFQSPYYLLIIQTLALALAAWPLYLSVLRILQSRKWALVLAAGYLLYPPLHWVNLFDFHEIAFFPLVMLTALYFSESKRWGWMALFLILSASIEENAILAVLFVGFYLLAKKEYKIGFLVVLLSAIYFILTVKVLMLALGGGLLRLDRYVHLGESFGEIAKNLVTNPQLFIETILVKSKLLYVLWLLLPVAFLPLLAGPGLILVVPGFLQNLLTFFEFQFSSFYQYDAILIPGIWVAAIFGLRFFLQHFPNREKLITVCFLLAVILSFTFRSPLNPQSFPLDLFRTTEYWETFRQMVKLVPPDVSVAAHTNLVPHLSHRKHAHMLGREPFAVDVVLLDLGDRFGFSDPQSFQNYVDSYLNTGRYEVTKLNDRFVMLIRADLK